VLGIVASCLVLGFGGLLVDHLLGTGTKAGTVPTPPTSGTLGGPPATTPDPHLASKIGALMELRTASGRPAPGWRLVDAASGRVVTPAAWRGKVVVLWFFDSRCDDICPVVEREMLAASAALPVSARGRVEFVAVNTDPFATARAAAGPALRRVGGLGGRFVFVTGTLPRLDAVWKAYGITVEAQPKTGLVSHTELCDFIDRAGRLVASATPSADQAPNGSYFLASSTIAEFGRGVASEAALLATTGR
jgi:cytochrome oxidase Cu insertion factor (SCO1/SenC/PrrC family)